MLVVHSQNIQGGSSYLGESIRPEMVVGGPGALPLLLCCRSVVAKVIYYSNRSNLAQEIQF